jgi:hypothetical protein
MSSVTLPNADLVVVSDTGLIDLKEKPKLTEHQRKYDEARDEIRRMADIGEFVSSPGCQRATSVDK